MKKYLKQAIVYIGLVLSMLLPFTVLSESVVTLTIQKNDAYASICSRQCDSVEDCFKQARQFDNNAGRKGLLKSISIKANNKVLLNRVY